MRPTVALSASEQQRSHFEFCGVSSMSGAFVIVTFVSAVTAVVPMSVSPEVTVPLSSASRQNESSRRSATCTVPVKFAFTAFTSKFVFEKRLNVSLRSGTWSAPW